MSAAIEWGKCEICGKEGQLHRTYFYYDVRCTCCGSKINGQDCHFEMVAHCDKCPAPMPTEIHPYIKAMDGKEYRANITNILPIDIRGEFIIDNKIVNYGTERNTY